MSYEQLMQSVDNLAEVNANLQNTVQGVQVATEASRDAAQAFAIDALAAASEVTGELLVADQVATAIAEARVATLQGELVDLADPTKGVGKIPSAIRTLGTVAEMVSMTGWVAGMRVQTLGYYAIGDGGGNVYTVIAKGALVVDGGRYIAIPNTSLLFRGEFVDNIVRVMQFGSIFDGVANDTVPWDKAAAFARTIGSVKVLLKPGTILRDPFTPENKDVLYGSGRERTFIKFTTGTHGLKLSSKAVGVITDRLGASKNVKLRDFTIRADNVDFGLYVNFGLFLDIDRVTVWNAKLCNAFIAYCFRCKFGDLTVEYGVGSGLEFGYNRFGWPNIVGESPVLNHGCEMSPQAYSNGSGLSSRPDTANGSVAGAGLIFGPGFSNNIPKTYCELNKGCGVVFLAGMSYTVGLMYFEKNDDLALVTDIRVELHNNSTEAAITDVFTEYGGLHGIWNAGNLCIGNHHGVRILGPGYTKITGSYRGTDASNPRLIPLLMFTARGTRVSLIDSFTLPTGLPPDSSRRYERSGAYRMYPEVTIEEAGTLTAGPTVRIYKVSDSGASVYSQTVVLSGAVTAGQRIKLPPLDFTWEPTETYRLQFWGLDGLASAKIAINLYVEVMV